MSVENFLDTNVFVYLFDETDDYKPVGSLSHSFDGRDLEIAGFLSHSLSTRLILQKTQFLAA